MALTIYDTIIPDGDYPAVNAENVQMPDGSRLSTAMPVFLTQDEYDALVAAGTVNENTPYMIIEG